MKKSTKKSLRAIGRVAFLLTLREGYITTKNVLGIIAHPFKTINEIKREKNYSQAVIIPTAISLPFMVIVAVSVFYLVIEYFLNFPLPSMVGAILKTFLIVFTIYTLLIFAYLGYWIFKVIRKNKS